MSKYDSLSWVYYGPGDVRKEKITIECGADDVILKILGSARCGTDRTIFYKGHDKVIPPKILGHELCGQIVEIGKDVKQFKKGIGYKQDEEINFDFAIGDRVTVQSRIARYSQDGFMLLNNPITILSFILSGGYSQYMKVPKELILSGSIIKVSPLISDESAALIEPAACALESIFATPHPIGVDSDGRHVYHSGVKKDGNVCIIGSGTVSMIYAQLCVVERTKQIIMLVRSVNKANLVNKILGKYKEIKVVVMENYSVKPLEYKIKAEQEIVSLLESLTDGYLFDDVICACPDPDAQRLMLKLYTPEGYAVGACFGGTHELVDAVDLDKHHYRSAKTIGTSGCSTRSMGVIVEWLNEGKISFEGFTDNRRFNINSDPKEFFTTTESGLKPVLYPWG